MSCSPSITTDLFNPNANRLVIAPSTTFHPTDRSKCKCVTNRRGFAFKGIVAAGVSVMGSSVITDPVQGVERLPFKPEGYNFWTWRGHNIHYVEQGEGFPIVLIHGFGASAFHWRYNIPELAKRYKVYAIDLLGFGWSDKAIIEYDAMVWKDQVEDFLKEIVKEQAILVGNRYEPGITVVSSLWPNLPNYLFITMSSLGDNIFHELESTWFSFED